MKNTKVNQDRWLNKIEDTLKIGGRSKRTFENYKSHIKRFLNYYDENTDINKFNEENILNYLKLNYLNLNKKIGYNILFRATSESILELSNDPKWLGAKVGITSILHTWGQTIEFHPHIHSIVTGGGLKNNQWISCAKDYIFKVKY